MELLIHISAPSAKKDDDKHKRQAQSYGQFESAHRVEVSSHRQPQHAEATMINGELTRSIHLPPPDDRAEPFTPAVFLDDTQLAISALESQILTASLKRRLQDSESVAEVSVASIVSNQVNNTASSGASATPSKRPRLADLTTPEPPRRLASPYVPLCEDGHLTIGFIGSLENHEHTSQHHSDRTITPRSAHKNHSSSWSGEDVPSQLPSTYSLSSENTSKRSRIGDMISSQIDQGQRQSQLENDDIAIVQHPSRISQDVPSTQAKNQPQPTVPISGSEVIAIAQTTVPSGPLFRSAPQLLATKTTLTPSTLLSTDPLAFIHAQPISLRPPPPDTSTASFVTHITPNLQTLIDSPQLSDRYRPSFIVRALETSERGFWSFKPNLHWSGELQLEFWTFLHKFIEAGNGGWGIWAARQEFDIASDSQHTTAGSNEQASEDKTYGLGRVKVFCWGEVVEHVYLLLYVASKSKIRKVGAEWLDAGEEVVIRM